MNNKLIKGITDDGMSNILDLLILSFNNYYYCGSERMHIDRNDFEISEVIYDNSDMINTYNKHLLINMLNPNKVQLRELIITTISNESEAIVKVFFENNILENTSIFSVMFRIDTHDKSDEWFEYY